MQSPGQLRARFAAALSALYAEEVPAYQRLVDTATDINRAIVNKHGDAAERLGDLHRVTAERHGAIRVGTPTELRQLATILGAFGMFAVGFYDLRTAGGAPVPVVSTAFRPIAAAELADNPFRLFVSVLVPEDARFFDAELTGEINAFLERRTLFGPEVLALAERCRRDGGLDAGQAEEFVRLAVESFRLTREPVDRLWYERLSQVSSVAADIAGVPSTHINHLTPRVLDIDLLYSTMQRHGIEMIDRIEGPPRWEGPDVLLRQTSFRALAEPRVLAEPDGSLHEGSLRVRFGEVEARGVALTAAGREQYELGLAEAEQRHSRTDPAGHPSWESTLADVWRRRFPSEERALATSGLAYYTVHPAETGRRAAPGDPPTLASLLDSGLVEIRPVVYEDFLPRSAAGIFSSNLTSGAQADDRVDGVARDARWLAGVIGQPVHDPAELAHDQVRESVRRTAERLGIADSW